MEPNADEPLLRAIVGAGRRGLLAALHARNTLPENRFALFDAAPQPGGDDLTRRSNGFGCELGAVGLAPAELAPFAALLPALPPQLELDPAAHEGALWDGVRLQPTTVAPAPSTFRSGLEDLWQACRRQLGNHLRLGRRVTTAERTADGWRLHLGGEVPTVVPAEQLELAVPLAAAADLLAPYDPALGDVAARLQRRHGAWVFLGDQRPAGDAVPGYGIAALPDVPGPLREVVHLSRAFPPRALPGRCLLRCELLDHAPAASDAELVELARTGLTTWLGAPLPPFGFVLVHRWTELHRDGAFAECAARVRSLPARVGALRLY